MSRNRLIRIMVFAIAAITATIGGACVCHATLGDEGSISAVNAKGEIVYICSGFDEEPGEVPGLSYDENSNTLTMYNYNGGTICINDMGSLKINLVGTNTINKITLSEEEEDYQYTGIYFYTDGLTINGSGTLNIGTSSKPVDNGIVNNSEQTPLAINSYIDIYASEYGIDTYGPVTIGSKMHIKAGMDSSLYDESAAICCEEITFDGDFSFSDSYSIRSVGGHQTAAMAGAEFDGVVWNNKVAREVSVVDYIEPYLQDTACTLYCYGQAFQNGIVNQDDKDFKWSTSNKKIATVSQTGLIKPQKPGTCKINAKSSTHTFVCTVTVKKPVLDKTSMQLLKGQTEKLTVQGGKGKITWKSSNKKIAKVNSKGVVTAVKTGACTITAKRSGYKCSAKVSVVSNPSFESDWLEVASGEQYKLNVIGGSGETTFSSDDENIATVDENGVITGAGDQEDPVYGETTIWGEQNGLTFSCTVYNQGSTFDEINVVTEANKSVRVNLGECGSFSERQLRIRSTCEGYLVLSPINDWDVDDVQAWRGYHSCLGVEDWGYGEEPLVPEYCMLTNYDPVIFATHKNEVYYISLHYFGGSGISGMGADEQTFKECFLSVENKTTQDNGGKTKAKARTMSKGKTYTGTMFEEGDTAWYKFKVTKKKAFKVTITCGMHPGADFYVFKGKKKLYLDECHPLSIGQLNGVSTFKASKKLGKGTYYIKVYKDFQVYSGPYSIKWSY